MSAPLLAKWDGEVFRPMPYFRRQVVEQFKPGEIYRLIEHGDRSAESHRHFFACVHEAWNNLREDDADRFPSADHLRKWALTFTPFCDIRSYRAASHSEALRVAKMMTEGEQYVRCEVEDKQVTIYTPHSQAYASMNNRAFQQSKSAVLDVLARKLGVSVQSIEAAARRAA